MLATCGVSVMGQGVIRECGVDAVAEVPLADPRSATGEKVVSHCQYHLEVARLQLAHEIREAEALLRRLKSRLSRIGIRHFPRSPENKS